MSSLLIWFWINDNQESCPAIRCPLSPQAALADLISPSCCPSDLAFHLPSFVSWVFLLNYEEIPTKPVSALQFWCLSHFPETMPPPVSLPTHFPHNVSLCPNKTVCYSLLLLFRAHALNRNVPFFSLGLNCGAEASASVRPSGEKNGWCFGTVRPQWVTSTWVRTQGCIWVFGESWKYCRCSVK